MERASLVVGAVLWVAGASEGEAQEACVGVDLEDPAALIECLREHDRGGRHEASIQPHDGCHLTASKIMGGMRKIDRSLAQDSAPSCRAIADVMERLGGQPPVWAECLGYDPEGDATAQVSACLTGYIAGRQARGDSSRVPSFLARLPCDRMQRTYHSALGDAYPKRPGPNGTIVALPVGFVEPGCEVYDAVMTAAQEQVASTQAAAVAEREAAAAAKAEQARRDREARRKEMRERQEARAKADAKRRADAEAKARAREQAEREAAEAEQKQRQEERAKMSPGEREALDKATASAARLAESMRKAAEAKAKYEALLKQREAAKKREGYPSNRDVIAGFRKTLQSRYPERECDYGFRSNLVGYPQIEVCANYIKFKSDCDKVTPDTFRCSVRFRINVTSPTHPNLTPQLQKNNLDVSRENMIFVREGGDWRWAADAREIDANVPSEFRGRDPFAN